MLQRISNGSSSPTDTISFNGYTDVTINGSQTSTTKYYSADGKTVAMRKDGTLSYLVPDLLVSVSLTLYADGSTESVQLYAPYGATRYSDGSTPTTYGFTGQRSDSTTGLMYYGARYYDPVSGRFISADTVETNATGQDPYGYVDGNPETSTDPTGHNLACPNAATSNAIPCGGGSPPPPSKPNPPSSPPSTGGPGSGGDGGVCTYELGCGSGTSSGSTGYPANTPSAPSSPASCDLSCQLAFMALMTGMNIVQPETLVVDPELLFLEVEEEENASEPAADTGAACSFIATTLVTTENGKQPIGSLKVGEKVVSYNQTTKKTELEVIRHVWINHDNDLVDLTITTKTAASKGKPAHLSSETLHTNKKHPFLTVEKGFVPVGQLKLNMHVIEADGVIGVVTGWKSVPGTQVMYNLEVTQDHTFTVGNGQWIVHNCAAPAGPGNWESANESMSARAQAYQTKITGQAAGSVYKVNGVKFDGYDAQTNTLLDAKGPGYARFVDPTTPSGFKPWWTGARALVDEAQRQVAAAPNTPIEWHIAEPEAYTAITKLLNNAGITGIQTVYTP